MGGHTSRETKFWPSVLSSKGATRILAVQKKPNLGLRKNSTHYRLVPDESAAFS
jgi:hypothetical protein